MRWLTDVKTKKKMMMKKMMSPMKKLLVVAEMALFVQEQGSEQCFGLFESSE